MDGGLRCRECFEYPPHLWRAVDPVAEGWETVGEEPMGSKEKHWVHNPDGWPWLLKFARQKADGVRGEDWAECVVHALAGLIGVPTACVRPAVCNGRRAVLSRAVQTPDERLEHGNELLARHDASYQKAELRENAGYTVAAVQRALDGVDAPDAATTPWGGFGVWAGYLVLDAWVAGRDRHHENWAVARGPDRVRLAPSFDHGNALGFAEPERRVSQYDTPERLLRWCEDGVSPHFAGQPSLVEIASEALRIGEAGVAVYWMGRLQDVRSDDVRAILAAVPTRLVSEPRRRFIERILDTNRERILDAFSG